MRAHPRSRGENHGLPPPGWPVTGSSPLTRGKPRAARPRAHWRGLIPAHAGKTRMRPRSRAVRRAHPRSRGENSSLVATPTSAAGSSPLTRGKLQATGRAQTGGGLIPAHAGKTERSRPPRRRCRAHPRSRGENPTLRRSAASWSGSSPLTRGKLQATFKRVTGERLIPAHAGKTH